MESLAMTDVNKKENTTATFILLSYRNFFFNIWFWPLETTCAQCLAHPKQQALTFCSLHTKVQAHNYIWVEQVWRHLWKAKLLLVPKISQNYIWKLKSRQEKRESGFPHLAGTLAKILFLHSFLAAKNVSVSLSTHLLAVGQSIPPSPFQGQLPGWEGIITFSDVAEDCRASCKNKGAQGWL